MSPPPIIVVASDSAKTFANSFVPVANKSNSATPTVPFQIIVFAFLNSSEYNSIVFGPMSRPSQPSGIESLSTIIVSVFAENSFPNLLSTGNNIFTFLALAFSINSFAKSILSSSQIEFPTEYPSALKNVYAIPPPINNTLTFSSKLSITAILSDTFDPPKIDTNGLSGFSNASPKNFSSFSIKNPETAGI